MPDPVADKVLRPETPKEVVQAVREARGGTILVRCGGSASHRGVSPGSSRVTLDLSHLDKITRLAPDDLSCGVQAGVSLEDLEAALAPHRLALESGPFFPGPPLQGAEDTPKETRGRSVGGILAEAPPAPRSFDRGRLRSQLIGIEAVDGMGRRFKAGGKVVKNVAGYDLCKLFVGSGGAYFVGLEFQLRLIALPARIALLRSPPLDFQEGIARWRELREALPTPRALDLVFLGSSCRLQVLLGGSPGYVEDQVRRTGFELVLEGTPAWKEAGRIEGEDPGAPRRDLFRGYCPPSRLAAWVGGAPLRGRIHYQGAFALDRLPPGDLPTGVIAHPASLGGTQVPGRPPKDPGSRRIAMALKERFGGGLMPRRLSFLTSVAPSPEVPS